MITLFTDPILRAPSIASMEMCLALSLIGVIVFLKKRSLVGEALSHASFPGIVVGALLSACFFAQSDFFMIACAFIFALLGMSSIVFLEKRGVKSDSALTFVLSIFFGVGILVLSGMQMFYPLWSQRVSSYIFGQVTTLTDIHIYTYGVLAFAIVLFILIFYRGILLLTFDLNFAKSIGFRTKMADLVIQFLLIICMVIGMKTVGVVLMSGMLIAPAVAARQWTDRLQVLFVLSGFIGISCGFLGNYLSLQFPNMPTGPMIILVSFCICLFSLCFSPKKGLVSRMIRILAFKNSTHLENALKEFWKQKKNQNGFICLQLLCKGYLKKEKGEYHLTDKGRKKAVRIVRLHRLWEVYLVDYLGHGVEKVHKNAEEMEHILTPELEKELTLILNDPKQDPHLQPIPENE